MWKRLHYTVLSKKYIAEILECFYLCKENISTTNKSTLCKQKHAVCNLSAKHHGQRNDQALREKETIDDGNKGKLRKMLFTFLTK